MDAYRSILEKHQLAANPPHAPIELLLDGCDVQLAHQQAVRRLAESRQPTVWANVGVVFEDEYLMILRDAVRFPSGKLGTYLRILEKPVDSKGVVIFPVLREKLLLTRHFRHATRDWMWEIPRGFASPGATWQENAQRELKEEIGVEAEQMILLGSVWPNSGLLSSAAVAVFAKVQSTGTFDDEEGISSIVEVDREMFNSMIAKGEIVDGFTLSAEALVRARGLW